LIKPNFKLVNSHFFEQVQRMNSSRLKHQISSGGAQPFLSLKEIGKLKLNLPTLPEQQKIATFLTTVDEKINLLKNQKIELERYKKGVMQKIFSQELRFKDDDGKEFPKWEKSKLKDVAQKKSSNIAANTIEDNNGEFIVYGASGELKRINFYQEENDYISIVKDGAGVGRLLYCNGKSSVLGTLEKISPISKMNTYFLFSILSNIDFTKYVTGSTIPHIYFKDYSNESIKFPCLVEQTKIANFLSALDEKIALNGEQITKMEVWKKGLLQQMFV
ncbi:MAG: restriction endonuclease subunit S, partial [Bacteroidetes bacterium]|nr:restriction endonuclease subunit S [Bacteroidota bacterium]